jgi:hypothetical protein
LLLARLENPASICKLDDFLISLKNVRQFVEQARYDPAVSESLQKGLQSSLWRELDIHSLKFQYASMYGKLVEELIAASQNAAYSELSDIPSFADDESSNQSTGDRGMQRSEWEGYVFKALETDVGKINSYLNGLFTSSKDVETAFYQIRKFTEAFEKNMAEDVHFNNVSLKWAIEGLVRSDLLADGKRKTLKEVLNNKVVMAEVADVLNMRMSSLDK